jgi:aminomethyltransferase
MQDVKRTVLCDRHLAAGAKMVDFSGWQMPVQYPDGIVAEHLWTRKSAGLFDVSHMGRFTFRGQGCLRFLQYVLSNDAARLDIGRAQYTIIPNETGGAVDDAYLYRFVEDEYLLVVNAANKDKDLAYLQRYAAGFKDVEMADVSGNLAMISLQGPRSEEILSDVLEEGELPPLRRNSLSIVKIHGQRVPLARTGYAGEPIGFEFFIPAQSAGNVWDLLIEQGAKPVGLGARDTLRLEAGLPLYGHEFGLDADGSEIPIFACPLAKFAVSFSAEKGDFIGKKSLSSQLAALNGFNEGDYSAIQDLPRLIRPMAIVGRGVARAGVNVLCDIRPVGRVTSGTMVPYWKVCQEGKAVHFMDETAMRAITLAFLDSDIVPGDRVAVDIRGRDVEAIVVKTHLQNRKPPRAVPVVV